MPSFQNPHEEGFAFFRNYHQESAAPLPGPSQRHIGRAPSLTNSGSLSFQKIVPTGPFPGTLELSLTCSPWPGPSDLAHQPRLVHGASVGQWARVNPRIDQRLRSQIFPLLTSLSRLTPRTRPTLVTPQAMAWGARAEGPGRVLGVKRPPWLQCPFQHLRPAEFRGKTGGVLRPFFPEILLAGLALKLMLGRGPCTEACALPAAKVSIPCGSSKLYDELFAPLVAPVPAAGVAPRVGQHPCNIDLVVLRLVDMSMHP